MDAVNVYEPKRLLKWRDARITPPSVLTTIKLPHHEALVVSKVRAGFDRATIDEVSSLLKSISDGDFDPLKFLVFDFAHGDEAANDSVDGFAEMVASISGLIIDAPIITLAWVRSLMGGSDFDFAMHCSAIVAESGSRFYFGGDPFELFGLYAALGRKIGFVKVERLIERAAMISAEEALELMIVKDVVAPQSELAASDAYLTQLSKRHNASCAIFRAQRVAEPPLDRRALEAANRA